jgi:hypothetical protein
VGHEVDIRKGGVDREIDAALQDVVSVAAAISDSFVLTTEEFVIL